MTGGHSRQIPHQRVNIVTGRQGHQATFGTEAPAQLLNTVSQLPIRQDAIAGGNGSPVTVAREVRGKRQVLKVKLGAHSVWSIGCLRRFREA